MAGLRTFLISIIAVVLFSFFLVAFIGSFIVTTNPSSKLLDSKYGLNSSYYILNESITDFSDTSKSMYRGINDSDFKPSTGDYLFLIAKGFFYIPLSMVGFGFNGIQAITSMLSSSFGDSMFGTVASVTFLIIFSVLLITLIAYIMKAIRTGEWG